MVSAIGLLHGINLGLSGHTAASEPGCHPRRPGRQGYTFGDDHLIAQKEMKEMRSEIQDPGDEWGANEPLWI